MNPSDHQAHPGQGFPRPANGLSHALPPENRQVIYGLPIPQHPQMVPVPIRGPIPGIPGLNPTGGFQSMAPINFNDTVYFNLPPNFRGYFGPAGQLVYGPNPLIFGPGGPPGSMGPVGTIGPHMVHPGQPSPSNSSVNSDSSNTESRNSSPGHKWNPNAKAFTPGQPWRRPDSDQTFRDPHEQNLSRNSDMENNSRRKLEDAF